MEMRFDLHAIRYGDIISADLEGSAYSESQCGECPHEHRCCDLIVTATPTEAAGILEYLARNAEDIMGLSRAIHLRATVLGEHFKTFGADMRAAIAAWASKRLKCVFYDHATKRCSVYPVRPIACRRAYGDGDCAEGDGIKLAPDTAEVLTARVARFKIHSDLQQNLAELTSLVANMAGGADKVQVDQEFFAKDPAALSDDQVIFGLAGALIRNPVALKDHNGRSIRS